MGKERGGGRTHPYTFSPLRVRPMRPRRPAAAPPEPTLVSATLAGKVWVTQVALAPANVVTSAGHWLVLCIGE